MIGIDTLMSLVFDGLSFSEKLIFIAIFLTVTFSSFIIFKKNKFLKRLISHYTMYWIGTGLFLIVIIFKILSIKYLFLDNKSLYYSIYLVYFASLVYSTIIPLIKYGEGLKIFVEKKILVPVSGEGLEVRIINKTKLSEELQMSLNLPDNVKIKNGDRAIKKIFRIRGNGRLFINTKISPSKNNLERIAFLNIKSNIFSNFQQQIIIKT